MEKFESENNKETNRIIIGFKHRQGFTFSKMSDGIYWAWTFANGSENRIAYTHPSSTLTFPKWTTEQMMEEVKKGNMEVVYGED